MLLFEAETKAEGFSADYDKGYKKGYAKGFDDGYNIAKKEVIEKLEEMKGRLQNGAESIDIR